MNIWSKYQTYHWQSKILVTFILQLTCSKIKMLAVATKRQNNKIFVAEFKPVTTHICPVPHFNSLNCRQSCSLPSPFLLLLLLLLLL